MPEPASSCANCQKRVVYPSSAACMVRRSTAKEDLRISGFWLSLHPVHGPEQVGEKGGINGRHLPDRFTRRLGVLHLGMKGAFLNGYTDVEHAHVDSFLDDFGVQGLQIVSLGSLSGTRSAHVW